jgi:Uma2 family endonuclease
MLVLDRPQGAVEADMPLTLDEYLSLPEDARAELVDGVLRPMVRAGHLHREVQLNLASALKAQRPQGLRVATEEVVVLSADPPHARIPDVAIFRGGNDPTGRQNSTPAGSVVLVVEIVSESTQTADRYEKPAEYARSGLPVFWRIELEPSIVVWTYRLVDGVYRDSGLFGVGDVVRDENLPWLEIDVTRLLGDFAPPA